MTMMNLADIRKQIAAATEAIAKADTELKWELAASAADVAGMVDPTPTSDLIGAGLAIRKGDWFGAGMSVASMVPYVGDALAKPAKAVRAAKKINALRETLAKMTTKLADLKKAEKQAEAAEAAAKEAKIAKEARETVSDSSSKQGSGRQQGKSNTSDDKDCESCQLVPKKDRSLKAGTPEHKANRWDVYQHAGGGKSYEQWSKQYDVNMRNYQYGMQRENEYRARFNATEGTLKTPISNRQVDILKESEMYAGQLKTGPVSYTKENALAIKKDAMLVSENWTVEHILEQGASKPYLEALEKAKIKYTTKPKF